jgi:hypothetical protein
MTTTRSLAPDVVETLTSLQPPRGPRHGRRAPRPVLLGQRFAAVTEEDVAVWLGAPPPRLHSLVAAGMEERFVTARSTDSTGGSDPGRPVGESRTILYVPADADWASTSTHNAWDALTSLALRRLPAGPPAAAVLPVVRSPATGDTAVFHLGSTMVGVQHRGPARTYLGWWMRDAHGVPVLVSVSTPQLPLPAVQLLMANEIPA